MKAGIIVFPGSNCDRDMAVALQKAGAEVFMLWHKHTDLPKGLDLITIPGGFSFGDYLRCGAIAANSPIMQSILDFAHKGGYIVGICNGFQVLTESGLLEGTLLRNAKLKFICKQQELIVNNCNSIITKCFSNKEQLKLPIAHHDGNYFAEPDILSALEENGQVLLRYRDNPNLDMKQLIRLMSRDCLENKLYNISYF